MAILAGFSRVRPCPEFEKAAFSLNKGEISDLIKTQYGFHIIKVLEKETAHTKTFEEVKDTLRAPYQSNKAEQAADAVADKLSTDIRQSNKLSLDELAAKYHLPVAETRPVSPTEPVFELGTSKDIHEQILQSAQRRALLADPHRSRVCGSTIEGNLPCPPRHA